MRSSARACVKMVDEFRAWVAQLVERVLGKDEVTGSIPVPGSRDWGRIWSSGGKSTVESHSCLRQAGFQGDGCGLPAEGRVRIPRRRQVDVVLRTRCEARRT